MLPSGKSTGATRDMIYHKLPQTPPMPSPPTPARPPSRNKTISLMEPIARMTPMRGGTATGALGDRTICRLCEA